MRKLEAIPDFIGRSKITTQEVWEAVISLWKSSIALIVDEYLQTCYEYKYTSSDPTKNFTAYLTHMKKNFDEEFVCFMEQLGHQVFETWKAFSKTSARTPILGLIKEIFQEYLKDKQGCRPLHEMFFDRITVSEGNLLRRRR